MQNENTAEAPMVGDPIPAAPVLTEVAQETPAVKVATQPESPSGFGTSIAITIMATLIINAAMLMAYDHFVAKKFISVDVKGFVEQQQALYLAGKITDEQLQKNYAALGDVVKAIPKNRVVLMGDAVLGGVEKIDVSTSANK